MNRELEFRAWDKENKKMYYIDDIGDVVFNYENDGSFTLFDCETGETPKSVFEQYVGLKDKHGVKLFEGDVVTSDNFWDMKKTNNVNYIIIFSQYGFKMQDKTGMEFNLPLSIGLEVIGNIHENQELLK